MKKLLLSATALVALAGAASADVTLSGDARFGVVYDSGEPFDGGTSSTEVRQRVRVFFNMSTETDGGATFGAKIGLDTRSNGGVAVGANGSVFRQLHPVIFADIAGFNFTLGNANGAVVELVGLWAGGLGFEGSLGRPGIVGGFDTDEESNQTLRVGYSFGDFKVAVSTQIAGDTDTEIAASYSANGILVAAGADTDDVATNWAVKAQYSANDWTFGAIYRDGITDAQFRLYGSYVMGATTFGVNYTDTGAPDAAYGIGVSHSLGGGVTASAAIGKGTDGDTEGQLGVTIGF